MNDSPPVHVAERVCSAIIWNTIDADGRFVTGTPCSQRFIVRADSAWKASHVADCKLIDHRMREHAQK